MESSGAVKASPGDGIAGRHFMVVKARGHKEYKTLNKAELQKLSQGEVLLFDIKGVLRPDDSDFYWKL